MDNHGNRELNDQLNVTRTTSRIALGAAQRAAKWACSRDATQVEVDAERAYRAAQRLHDTFYDWDLHEIMEEEEEEESRQEELGDYVNRVHREIFPQL